jgi:hypothetical protein
VRSTPKKVIVGPHTYKVVVDQGAIDGRGREERSDLLGHTDRRRLVITLAPDQNLRMLQESLLHEVLHCVTGMSGLAEEWSVETEEAAVNRLAPILLDVFRRNPALVSFLRES